MYRIRDEDCCFLLGNGDDLCPGDGHLVLPAEDVAVEAAGAGGDVEAALVQDVAVVGAAVVHHEPGAGAAGGAEQVSELLSPSLVAGVHARVVP